MAKPKRKSKVKHARKVAKKSKPIKGLKKKGKTVHSATKPRHAARKSAKTVKAPRHL